MLKRITIPCRHISVNLPKIDTLFLKIFISKLLIQDLISRLTGNQNEISVHQNLCLGVDNRSKSNFENRSSGFCFMAR